MDDSAELPAELDFFKYTQGGSGKRKGSEDKSEKVSKKARVADEDEVDDEDDESNKASTSAMPRQRVTAKGNNVPQPVETFEELSTRSNLQPQLLSKLADSGYHHPTGIQAHGIPILLEVRITWCMSCRDVAVDMGHRNETLQPSRQLAQEKPSRTCYP